MNPCINDRGLCLRSTSTQKGDLSALVSSRDTSESKDSEQHDKQLVFTQNLPDKERSAIARSFTLRVLVQQPDEAQAGVCEPSLSAELLFCRWLCHLTQS